MGPEKQLREKCRKLASTSGGVLLPLRGWLNGTPDCLLAYNGRLELVEFKAPDEDLSPTQKLMAAKIASTGSPVNVVRSVDQFKALLWVAVMIITMSLSACSQAQKYNDAKDILNMLNQSHPLNQPVGEAR